MILVPQDLIAEYKRKGWWGEDTLVDLFDRHVREQANAEACIDPPNLAAIMGCRPRRLSWGELNSEVQRIATVLQAHGVVKDSVVLVQLPNCIDLCSVMLACLRLGAIVTPTLVQFRHAELLHVVQMTEPVVAVTATRIGKYSPAEAFRQLQAQAPSLQTVFEIGENVSSGAVDLRALLSTQSDANVPPTAPITADDVATLCWTSGTEAQPKGVPRSHNQWTIMSEGVVSAASLRPGMCLLNPFPMVNMAGISTGLVTWLLLGGRLVQHHPFDLPTMLQQIREERVDYTVAPPAILNQLLQQPALLEGIDFNRLSRIGSGSAPLSEWMVRTFQERHGVEIINYFGSNEGCSFASCIADIPDAAHRASYFPRTGVDGLCWQFVNSSRQFTRLVDPLSAEEIREPGRPGELHARGPTIFTGYWRAPELTAKVLDAQGWYRSGDLFEIAGEHRQYYRYVGRLKDIVVRGGVKISTEEIELHLLAHAAVAEAAVIGVPDDILGERICAFVVPRPGCALTLEALNGFLIGEKRLAVYKQIERLHLIDALPRNALGKVLKRELRQQILESRE